MKRSLPHFPTIACGRVNVHIVQSHSSRLLVEYPCLSTIDVSLRRLLLWPENFAAFANHPKEQRASGTRKCSKAWLLKSVVALFPSSLSLDRDAMIRHRALQTFLGSGDNSSADELVIQSYLSLFLLMIPNFQCCVGHRASKEDSPIEPLIRHRFIMFWQLAIFCALAAFTNNFDITSGITSDAEERSVIATAAQSQNLSAASIGALNYRNERVPDLGFRGISLMGCSRLALLL